MAEYPDLDSVPRQMSADEKRELARKVYASTPASERHKVRRLIAEKLAVSIQAVDSWVKRIRKARLEEMLREMRSCREGMPNDGGARDG